MTEDQEAILLAWYGQNARVLPWRESRELYPVLVSELMLQQTTVAAVVPHFERWMARFPTIETLAQADPDDVMQAWSGLGYYSRARRLHQTAQRLASGSNPTSLADLLALPGLGAYTAAAVASIALGLPHLALDTNVLRVLLRFYGWPTRADLPSVHERLRQMVESGLPKADFGITNQALMELGAKICSARAPACLACPWSALCQARALGQEEEIPLAKPRKAVRVTKAVAHLVTDQKQQLLLVRGTSLGLLGDLYQPPIDFGEENHLGAPLTALLERLRESEGGEPVSQLKYGISGRRLELTVQLSQLQKSEQALLPEIDHQFWKPGAKLGLSSLTRKILRVSEESRAALRPKDESCSEFLPGL